MGGAEEERDEWESAVVGMKKFDIVAKMMYLGDSSMNLRPESSRGRSKRVLGWRHGMCHITKLDGVIPPRRGANSVRFPRLWLKPAELKSPLIIERFFSITKCSGRKTR